MGFWQILSLAWSILKGVGQFFAWLSDYIIRSRQDKDMADLKKRIEEAKNAKTIEEKARSACAIEKNINPNADCDHGNGD